MPGLSRWKRMGLWLVTLAIIFFAAPNMVPRQVLGLLPDRLFMTQAAFGQELQGKSRLLLEVARDELIDERVKSLLGEIRSRLRNAMIAYDGLASSERAVQVRVHNTADIEEATTALADLLVPASVAEGTDPVNEVSFEELERGFFKYTLTDAGIDYRVGSAVEKSVEVIDRRLHELGIADPIIERQGADRILVEITGLHDQQRLMDIVVRPSRLTFQWVDQSVPVEDAINGHPPVGSSILYSIDQPPMPFLVEDRVVISDENILDARAAADESTSEPVIRFRLDREGARLFGEATQENVGRMLAVILDSQVIMAPIIREPILGGNGQISGNLTMRSTEDLALLLRAGSLPAALNVVESRFTPADP